LTELSSARRWAIDVRPLRVPAYRRMWFGNAVSSFGFQLTGVAVAVEMYDLTRDSFWVGLIGVAGLVPLLVFGLWGGAVADAIDRRKLLIASSSLMWASTAGLLAQAVLHLGSPVLLIALVAMQTTAFAISSPARQAIIPRLVGTELVPAANTLNFTTWSGSAVAGPLAAGLILAAWGTDAGVSVAYAIDGVLFALSFWATVRLPSMPPEGEHRSMGLRSVADGLKYLATTPVLLLSFAIDIIAMVLAMPKSLFPEAAEERFGGGAAAGWLFSAIAIGSMLGGLTSGWTNRVRRQGRVLVAAVIAWGLAIAAAGLAQQLWLAVVLLAVAGGADLVSAVNRQSILQTYAPDRMRGRLQGVNITVVAGGPRLGDLRAGTMAGAWGLPVAWVGGGLAAAVLALALAMAFPALLRYQIRSPHG
jgi:MFS family permease